MFLYTSVTQLWPCQNSASATTGGFMASHNIFVLPHKITEAKTVLRLNYRCEQLLNMPEDALTSASTEHLWLRCST